MTLIVLNNLIMIFLNLFCFFCSGWKVLVDEWVNATAAIAGEEHAVIVDEKNKLLHCI